MASHSDAPAELVRQHLVTSLAMPAQLLDYVVAIADRNGNTVLHYFLPHAILPAVCQMWTGCLSGG